MLCLSHGGLLGVALVLLAVVVLLCGLLQRLHHILLQSQLLQLKSVLVPQEVGLLRVPLVLLDQPLEQLVDPAVVRVRSEAQRPAILHELLELARQAETELLQRYLFLLFLDVVVFFVLRAAGETLPRQLALQEVEQDVADGFEIVTAGLLVAQVRRQGGIPGRAGQVLALAEGNVLAFRVFEALCQAEVNDVNVVLGALGRTDEEVVRLDVSVDDPLLVDPLDPLKLQEEKY